MEDGKGKWHVRKEISYGQIATILTIALAALIFTVRLEGRINVNMTAINNNSDAIDRVESRAGNRYLEIIRRLERISDKLDTKADKL